ncbi:viperin family antiviral radical SAM protein [Massilia sp. IC2-278]|uniref:viperin family antiviral radical SAM protein n=1 Tax=Massilia sp. IC2-278 TaxID=2887200 RepID=UPI001E3944BC|nr:viperin family antiviral radical SAM protein [Massilia sp. IC2-278]MCC2959334.1 viperin family antiviral radical SAM protein [Massilia sp. IC2-278]
MALDLSFTPRPAGQLVINWHVTEACNYSCQYCYAKWEAPDRQRDLVHDPVRTKELLVRLYDFFHPDNHANPLRQDMDWSAVRLNLAGGEPLLYASRLLEMLPVARDIGFDVSLITNGSRLDPGLMASLAPSISLLGLSIDSPRAQNNREIGRMDRRGRGLDIDSLARAVDEGRRQNPALKVKVNTVVNKVNQSDDLTDVIQRLRPDKWKVLRMLPVVDDRLAVPQQAFDDFVRRHAHLAAIRHVEDNQDMTESYLMVDPMGRFFQNVEGGSARGYRYSQPILEAGASAAFVGMRFSAPKFLFRYKPPIKATE